MAESDADHYRRSETAPDSPGRPSNNFTHPAGSLLYKALVPLIQRPGAAEWACRGNKEPCKEELGGVFCIL